MANTNGTLLVNGIQLDVPQGSVIFGPWAIPFTEFSDWSTIVANSTNTAVPVPITGTSGVQGVALVPNNTAAMTCSAGFITAQLTRLSTIYPTIWLFDLAAGAQPSDVYVTVSNTTGALVSVGFF